MMREGLESRQRPSSGILGHIRQSRSLGGRLSEGS